MQQGLRRARKFRRSIQFDRIDERAARDRLKNRVARDYLSSMAPVNSGSDKERPDKPRYPRAVFGLLAAIACESLEPVDSPDTGPTLSFQLFWARSWARTKIGRLLNTLHGTGSG